MGALFDLSGKTALVTGGSRGIGGAIAVALADAGARLVVAARNEGELERMASVLRDRGAQAKTVPVDLTEPQACDLLAERASEPWGPVDILVNAAGVNLRQPAEEISRRSWDTTLQLNLSVPFFLARSLVGHMRRSGWGRIINIASLQSVRAFPNSIAYGASKGGVCQMTRAMAEAWSGDGVTANAIAPGFFPTALTAGVFADTARAQSLAEQTAVGRNGRLEDLHGVAVFLAAPASNYVTGQTLFVDGGFTAK